MRILIADKLSSTAVDALKSADFDVVVRPELAGDELTANMSDVQVLVVRSTRVEQPTIDAANQLSLIVRAGAGVNTIDVDCASNRGVYVTNCPGKNSDAVAELTIGLLIACDRQIAPATSELQQGRWEKKKYGASRGLRGRTLGVIGTGMIGQAVIERALGLKMKVLAWSRSLDAQRAEQLGVERADSILDVAEKADAVTLHLAATGETRGLANAEFFGRMQPGAIFLNTSRGDLVDTTALQQAITEKQLRVGLDVFENEPGGGSAEFTQTELAKTVTCTPHIGASTGQASEAIADEVVRIIKTYRHTGRPPNTVNMCARSPATHSLVVRHWNRVGVLAAVLDALRSEQINVEEMENAIFDGAATACCTLQLDQAPSDTILRSLAEMSDVLQVHLEPR